MKKKWKNSDIQMILEMKRLGYKLAKIGLSFGVTANATRKALQRHCPAFIKVKNQDEDQKEERILFSTKSVVNWAKDHRIVVKDTDDALTELALLANKNRFFSGLQPFRIFC